MYYQEALPKFWFESRIDSLLTIGDRHWKKVPVTFEKAKSANFLLFVVPFHVGYCVGAYKHNVVVVIKMDAYIHGCIFCVGAYYPDFTVCLYRCFTYGSLIRCKLYSKR